MVNRTFDGNGRFGMHAGKKHLNIAPDKLASLLGMTEDQLKTELKSGKSLTDIAAKQGNVQRAAGRQNQGRNDPVD